MKRSVGSTFKPNGKLPLLLGGVLILVLAGIIYATRTGDHKTVVTPSPTPTLYPTPHPSASSGPGKDTSVHSGPSSQPGPSASPTSNPDHPITGTLTVTQTISSHTFSRTAVIDSTCLSVMGATCYIQATNGSQTVAVSDTKTINDETNGVDLPWNASKIPSTGTWKIQAVAKASGGRQGISDPETVVVSP